MKPEDFMKDVDPALKEETLVDAVKDEMEHLKRHVPALMGLMFYLLAKHNDTVTRNALLNIFLDAAVATVLTTTRESNRGKAIDQMIKRIEGHRGTFFPGNDQAESLAFMQGCFEMHAQTTSDDDTLMSAYTLHRNNRKVH